MSDVAKHRQTIVYLAVFVEGGLILLAWVLGWLMQQPPLMHFGWLWQDALWGLLFTVPMVVAFFVMVWYPVGPLQGLKKLSEKLLAPLFAPCTIVDLVGIAVLAGLGEEMLFRGVFQSAFTRWMGPWWALVFASFLFGMMHALTVTYAIVATLLGAYLGLVLMFTDNLLAPVVMHAVYDFVALVYLVRYRAPELPDLEEEEGGADEEPFLEGDQGEE